MKTTTNSAISGTAANTNAKGAKMKTMRAPVAAPMTATVSSANKKAQSAPAKQPEKPKDAPAAQAQGDAATASTAKPASKKTSAPKGFSVEPGDIKLSEKQEKVHLAQQKALFIFRKVGKGGIVLKSDFMQHVGKVEADKEIDAHITKALDVWNKDNDDVKAGGEWLDQVDIAASFIKAFVS